MSRALPTWTAIGRAACGCTLETIAEGVVTSLTRCARDRGRPVAYSLDDGEIRPTCDWCHQAGAMVLVPGSGATADVVCEACRTLVLSRGRSPALAVASS